MGRSYTPKYALVVDDGEAMIWNGAATDARLQKHVEALGQSMNPGGVNAHLRGPGNTIPYPRKAFIRRNVPGGEVVARWTAPLFMIW